MAGTKRKNTESNPDLECYIGIDVGTQGTKAVLYHPKSQTIKARSSAAYDLDDNDELDNDGNSKNNTKRAEQQPSKWIEALHKTLKELSLIINNEGYIVAGIGVSGQQHGMVALDENYDVIRPAKLWCDVEASSQAERFSQKATEIMAKEWTIPAGFTAPKVLWMKEMEPQNWDKTRWIVLPHDYINLCLRTGIGHDYTEVSNSTTNIFKHNLNNVDKSIVPNTDAGDASGTGILDQNTREYVKELAQIIDEKYFNILPKILSPNEISGYLSNEWKVALNIDRESKIEIPISVGSGDNMMSSLGCKCVFPGNAVLSLGTSGTIFGVSTTPVQTGTPVAAFCDATGKHLPLVCVMSCTGVLNSVLEHWCSTPNSKMTHEEASKLAGKIPPGCNGLSFLPYLGGERTPNWPHATGALLGITAQNINCMSGGQPGLVYRAAMEGITFLLAEALNQMTCSCSEGGFNPKSIFVVGGGSKNKFWRQMLADVLELELLFPLEPESAALGAAFQAGAAATGTSVDIFISQQTVKMEDTIVKPTNDRKTLNLYKDALNKYREFSTKLFK